MAYLKAQSKGCLICGGGIEHSNASNICNLCKDRMAGKPASKPKKKRR